MTEGSDLPVAGWYDDPEIALRLRWWDGKRWSQHTRPKPVIDSAPAAPPTATAPDGASVSDGAASATVPQPSETSTIAAPVGADPYSYSVPYSFTPGSAPDTAPGSAPRSSPADPASPSQTTQLGTFGARAVTHHELWNTMGEKMEYAPERTTTVSAWMLAFTPLVAFLAQLAVTILTGFDSTLWFWIVASALLPILWIIVFVRRDRERLHAWGHLERASAWWALLGSYGYLTARGIVVQRQAGRGWWPLVVTILLTAALVGLGVFSPALFLIFLTPVP